MRLYLFSFSSKNLFVRWRICASFISCDCNEVRMCLFHQKVRNNIYITNVRPSLNGNNISKRCRHVHVHQMSSNFQFSNKRISRIRIPMTISRTWFVNTTDNSAEDTFHFAAMYIIKVWQKQKICDTIDCHCSSNRYSKYTKSMRTNPTWTVRSGNLSVLCKTISQQYD